MYRQILDAQAGHVIVQDHVLQHAHQTAQARIVEAMDAAAHAEHAQEHKHAAQQDNAILSTLHYVRQTAQEKIAAQTVVVAHAGHAQEHKHAMLEFAPQSTILQAQYIMCQQLAAIAMQEHQLHHSRL